MRLRHLFAALILCCLPAVVLGQTGQLNGAVSDPQGAAIVGVTVQVISSDTNSHFDTRTNDHGEWLVPSLPVANYRVVVALPGFQTAEVAGIKLNANSPATVNIKLEIGNVNNTVEVSGGAEALQTTESSITTNLVGLQINQLPMNARNATELLVLLPGTATPGTSRTSSINGLPKGSLNMTMDGINIQDNLLKSSDGFFANIQPKPDAVEEVAVTTAGGGADVLGEGAAQVRFVTKSGTNRFHGALFWQHRNTDLDSNYYFNTIDGIPRDRLILNQFGGSVGGPIKRNRLFFFVNQEWFRLPQTYNSAQELVPVPTAINGTYSYIDSSKVRHDINLYNVAALGNATLPAGIRPFSTTPDPSMLSTLTDFLKYAQSGGSLTSRIAKAQDYNRSDYTFQTNGMNRRSFLTAKMDWVATSKHHADLVVNYQTYFANPDGVNGILPIANGTGTVLGNPASGGTRRISFSGVGSLRSAWTPRLTSEIRYGLVGGDSIFRDEITPALFSRWNGYAPVFNSSTGYITSPYNSATNSRRNSPVKQLTSNFTFVGGAHTLTFGGGFTQVNLWQQSNGTQLIPTATLNIATNDPINTGATGIFTTTNFPGSTPAQRTEAQQLYAILTGRVSAVSKSLALDEKTRQYLAEGSIDRDRQREFAFFVQDSWKLRRNLTLNVGLRWDVQLPFVNLDGLYSTTGIAGAWGVSGVGNLFKPGVLTGIDNPAFRPVTSSDYGYNANYHTFYPSIGLAYTLPQGPGILRWLTGKEGQSVFRGGYSISSVREDTSVMTSIWGSNQGRSVSASADPSNNPAVFGPAGSVLLRDGVLPSNNVPATPVFPIPVNSNTSINEFDSNLRQAYVQSWTVSFQRELVKDTVLDVRYVANHGVGLWRQYNLNEVNIFENGFLNEFKIAQNNLAIAQAKDPSSVNFGNQGLAGQANIPIISTALGFTSDTATATTLGQGQAGSLANSIAFNTTRMAALIKAGYPKNMFVVNPATNSGSFLVANGGSSTFNSLQVEMRRRLRGGLLAQGSYVYGKALSNMDSSSSSVFDQPSTFRNSALDKGSTPWDIRHAYKMNYIYELPFGLGRRWMSGSAPMLRKVVEGWEVSGGTRLQSGSPAYLRSGRQTVNSASGQSSVADAGVVLHGLTAQQLNDMVAIRKTPGGLVYFLPQSLIDNSAAAFEVGGKTLKDLDPNQPYIGPPTTAGVFGERIYLYGPWQTRVDFSILKRTTLAEKKVLEFRMSMLNAFNDVNFLLGSAGNDVNTLALSSATFGQTRSAYRDITVSGANDPGGRMIEFQLRFIF